ncbi:DUF4260 domain-containing protein [Dyadobacter psychrotolerans]|uniref:DUF4260 family protein n=1 Tax=Dyadobacter psychrotolerans TaxID=2541721 RepID=A0A4R5DM54_9BACT|nr:DUF4260 domain-containing protein [Dyadobacter psychrotolerans]TDE11965.1 DUF4260 family protein [Dyadobacter psychrotolerans]
MKTLLKLEDLAELVLSIFVFSHLDFGWWWYPALILLPDLSMIGYVVNPKVGASLYNFVHHKGLGILIGIGGFVLGQEVLILSGAILFGHSAMDRLFGYGLKYDDDFSSTHLGKIGK